MKLEIKKGSENYCCTVVKIDNLHAIEGADFIQRTVIFGNNVIISKDIKEGDIMLYFNSGTKLNPEFCKVNNLYSNTEYNADPTAKKGYLSYKQNRVKAIKLKDIISDGFLLPLNSLDKFLTINDYYQGVEIKMEYNTLLDGSPLKIGDTFTDINGVNICEKYIVAPPRNSNPGGSAPNKNTVKLKDLLVKDQFRLHTDTAHFARNLSKFNPTDNIVITRKYHGTSGISSYILIQRSLNFIERLLLWFGINIPTTEYGYIYSSGKPKSGLPKGVFNSKDLSTYNNTNKSFYKENYWLTAFNKLKPFLEKGITLYYEIVGEGVQGKDYTYGFDHEIFIYRITQTNIDGIVYEFSWQQVKDYCNKYGIKHVQEYISNCKIINEIPEYKYSSKSSDIKLLEIFLNQLTDTFLNRSYSDCKIDEGICIRNERTNEIFKLKSPNFILAENDTAEKDIIDIESLE